MSTIMRKSVDNVNRSSETPAEEVFEAIHELMHLYRARRQQAMATAGQELTHMEAKTLGFYARHPDSTLSDLVAHSGRDKSQLARLISGLRERGLLDARPDEQDRRNLRLRCTEQAEAMHRTMRQQSRRLARDALVDVGEAERSQLLELLHRVKAGLSGLQPGE